jgi:hypothetical protein
MSDSPYLPDRARKPFSETLVELVTQLTGGAAAVGSTAATGEPLVGVGAGVGVSQLGGLLGEALTRRRDDRVHRTIRQAATRIEERQASGEKVRLGPPEDEDRALELIEAALNAANNSSEQIKADLIGSLLASAAFDSQVSSDDLVRYLKLLERLSRRQVVALAYLEDGGRASNRQLLAASGEKGGAQINPTVEAELDELGRVLGLVGFVQKDGGVANPSNVMNGGQIVAANIANIALTSRGKTLHRLAEVGTIVGDESVGDFESNELFNWG